MKKLFIILTGVFCLSGTTPALAKKSADIKRKPNQESSQLQFKILFGEKTSFFSIAKTDSGAHIDFQNNQNIHSSKDISARDYEYITKRVSTLTASRNNIENCSRSYIEFTDSSKKVTGCIGSFNKTTHELQEITNLIAILF